jgi:hypothetical protein
MKSIFLFFVITLFVISCADVSTPVEKEFIVSDSLQIGAFPAKVIQFGAGQKFSLSKLKVKQDNYSISGSVNYKNLAGNNEDFLFVLYVVGEKHMIFAYYTTEIRETFVTPSGSMGDVAFTAEGYKVEGNTIRFSLPNEVNGVYNISNEKGRIFVFCLDGNKENQIKEDSFIAISDVLISKY